MAIFYPPAHPFVGGWHPWDGFRSATIQGSVASLFIVGKVKDASGSGIAGATVYCYNTLTDVLVFTATADANGNYSGIVPNTDPHYVVAYLAGTPDRAGTGVNTLTGS